MKKIVYLIILIAVGFSSCKDQDSTYREYLISNGIIYPQRVSSLQIYPGLNSVRLTWLKANDPKVIKSKVYWSNYTDSLDVDVPAGRDTIIVDVPNLDENTYTFHVITLDADGNTSIPVEITGTPYGDFYKMKASSRSITSAVRDEDYTGIITWGAKTGDLIYSEVRYTVSSGEKRTLRVLPDETVVQCPDIKPGEVFEYRSVFLPPNGINVVEKEWETYQYPFLYNYPRNGWTVEARNGNHSWGDGGGGQPALILDGNTSTGWHSRTGTPLPQCVVIDMKQSVTIHHIALYPPTNTGWRYLKNIEIYLSNTPIIPDEPQPSWGEPVARTLYSGDNPFDIIFTAVSSGQYLAIVFIDSTAAPNSYISFMEVQVYGY
ncbi:MAG: discoidin domain-containing protein [Tannerella sp.]|jgi:hypothetical protein|nr:discoidin domain-containing protein [Tannerella sp.]